MTRIIYINSQRHVERPVLERLSERRGLCPSVKPEPTCPLPLEPQEGTARHSISEHAAHQENHLVQKKQDQGHRYNAPLRESKILAMAPRTSRIDHLSELGGFGRQLAVCARSRRTDVWTITEQNRDVFNVEKFAACGRSEV